MPVRICSLGLSVPDYYVLHNNRDDSLFTIIWETYDELLE